MRTLIILLTLVAGLSTRTAAQNDEPNGGSEAIVTVHITDLGTAWNGLSARIGKEPGVNIEYSCTRAGILVLRLQHLPVSEKADVMSVVRRLLNEGGISGAVEFLHVHVEQQGWGEC